jgi:hypothetical protein
VTVVIVTVRVVIRVVFSGSSGDVVEELVVYGGQPPSSVSIEDHDEEVSDGGLYESEGPQPSQEDSDSVVQLADSVLLRDQRQVSIQTRAGVF